MSIEPKPATASNAAPTMTLPEGTPVASATTLDLLLVDAEGLGRLLKLGRPDQPGSAAKAVNERIYRRGAMPPGMMVPGAKKRLWSVSTVLNWMRQFEGQVPLQAGVESIKSRAAPRTDQLADSV